MIEALVTVTKIWEQSKNTAEDAQIEDIQTHTTEHCKDQKRKKYCHV